MSTTHGSVDGFNWPENKTAAATLSFDVDLESAVLTVDAEAAKRLSVMSHQQYGARVGVPRILRMLERQDVRCTFFVPAYDAANHPDLVKMIADAGHEIAHHGYMHESVLGLSRQDETDLLLRGIDILEGLTGRRPVGYRAPMWETNYQTPELLARQGFLYDSSLMDDDVPYRLFASEECSPSETDSLDEVLSVIELPIHWSLDDWEQYGFVPGLFGSGLIESPTKAIDMWSLELEAAHSEGVAFNLVNHPFLTGRPSRTAALEGLVEQMRSLDGLWLTTMEEMARHAATVSLVSRLHRPPVVPQP